MDLDGAMQAVQALIADNPSLRIARRGIREDDTHYLVPVLDARQMSGGDQGAPSESRLLVVDKRSGAVDHMTVSAALARSRAMRAVAPSRD